jgi:hypothetical protein
MKRLLIVIVMTYLSIASAVVMKQQPCASGTASINQALIQNFADNKPQANVQQIDSTQSLLNIMRDFFTAFDKVLQEPAEQQQINKTFYQNYLQIMTLKQQRGSMGPDNFQKYLQKNNLPSLESLNDQNESLYKQFTDTDKETFVYAQAVIDKLAPGFIGGINPDVKSFLNLIINQLSGRKAIQAIPLTTTSQSGLLG